MSFSSRIKKRDRFQVEYNQHNTNKRSNVKSPVENHFAAGTEGLRITKYERPAPQWHREKEKKQAETHYSGNAKVGGAST